MARRRLAIVAGKVKRYGVTPGAETSDQEGVGTEENFGGRCKLIKIMDHHVHGEWDSYGLAYSAFEVFVRPAAALRCLQTE